MRSPDPLTISDVPAGVGGRAQVRRAAKDLDGVGIAGRLHDHTAPQDEATADDENGRGVGRIRQGRPVDDDCAGLDGQRREAPSRAPPLMTRVYPSGTAIASPG